jgi:hypothetical protein
MAAVRGLGLAFALFAAAFALHIAGGATGQDWLFAVAVALIFVTATGFPALALWLGGLRHARTAQARVVLVVGWAAGVAFTIGALWAASDRAFAWWQFPLAPALVGAVSLRLGWDLRGRRAGFVAGPDAC